MTEFVPSLEQGRVIDHGEEPLRVVAGAGTGKTTTMVLRIARFIDAGGDPARALAITFTNKAADELRDRLRGTLRLHPEGREPEVATYHSFAASILDEFGARIRHEPGYTVMDEGHRSELAARVLRDIDDPALDLTAIAQRRDELLTISDALNDNLIDAQHLEKFAPRELDDIWTRRLALARAAAAFAEAKARHQMIEFSDLIARAVKVVDTYPEVAAEIASRYDQVVMDEYQDTDPSQRILLRALFASGPVITAVGDADQTIYEWRGASLENFEAFPTDFPKADGMPAATLPLSVNRRSDRLIIDLANDVRTQLPAVSHSFDLVPNDDAGAGAVVASWFRTDHEEASWIAEQVTERHGEGIAWKDMAVLSRTREGLRPIAHALRDAGVPFEVGAMGELLQIPEIADIVAWLRLIADPRNEPPLLRVLMGGRYRIGMADIAAMRTAVKSGAIDVHEPRLIDAALHADRVEFSELGRRAIASFAVTFLAAHRAAQAMSVRAIVDEVLDTLKVWEEVAALPPNDALTARINLTRFIDLADRWRPLDATATLGGFLRYLDALDESRRAAELDAATDPSEDAVRLSTAHGAKGLEWSDVYLPGLADKVFPAGIRSYFDPERSALVLPYDVRLDADSYADVRAAKSEDERKRLLKIRHDHQEWRLAYVSVTRAKHRLVLSGHAWDGEIKNPRTPSDLLVKAKELVGAQIGPFSHDPGPRPEPAPWVDEGPAPDPVFTDGWDGALREAIEDPEWFTTAFPEHADDVAARVAQMRLEIEDLAEPTVDPEPQPFATSVTNLVALAQCPLRFKWIHHDRLPRRPRASALRGTEFHRRVERHNLGRLSLDDLEDATYDEGGPAEGPSDAAQPAVDPWAVFEASRFHDRPADLVEAPFEIAIDDRTVRGKVDAVYVDDTTWEIVDYKSGAPKQSDALDVQLQAYAVAASRGALSEDPPEQIAVTFAYFGVDPVEEASQRVDDEWLARANERLAVLLEQADVGPFPASPGAECQWCDFLHHCEAGKAFLAHDA